MDGDRTPLGVVIAPASEHEVRHIERLLDAAVVELPSKSRLLYDAAADSDPSAMRQWTGAISAAIHGRMNPGAATGTSGGTAVVRFTVMRSGSVTSAGLARSSGAKTPSHFIFTGSRPRNRLRAMERSGASEVSWWIVSMPRSMASRAVRIDAFRPRT